MVHPAVLQRTGGRLSASQAQTKQAEPVAAARPGVSRQLWCGVPFSTVWHDSCTWAVPQASQPVWAAPDCRLSSLASRSVKGTRDADLLPDADLINVLASVLMCC